MNILAQRIRNFLSIYGKRAADDPREWNGPDPACLEMAADILESGEKPNVPFSEWSSGCYKPYFSKEGKEEHDAILKAIKQL